jgi:hypothetical protein
LRVTSIDIRVNAKTRESRLFKNMFEHIYKSGVSIIRLFIIYSPGKFFFIIGSIFNFFAFLIGFRYLYLVYFISNPDTSRTYIPSLILLVIFAFWGILSYFLGVLGEILKINRKIGEEINTNLRKLIHK